MIEASAISTIAIRRKLIIAGSAIRAAVRGSPRSAAVEQPPAGRKGRDEGAELTRRGARRRVEEAPAVAAER